MTKEKADSGEQTRGAEEGGENEARMCGMLGVGMWSRIGWLRGGWCGVADVLRGEVE